MNRPRALIRLLACAAGLAVCAAGLAACGGGDSDFQPSPAPAKKVAGPSLDQVIAAARKNPGFAGCKEIAPGAVQKKEAATDPETIQALLCDGQIVSLYWVWGSEAEAAAKTRRDDRPSFVNRRIVVTTGEALLAKQYDAAKARTLPAEIKSACGCGTVVTP